MDKNQTPNRLIHETSPYLLQHAYNPVDWFPWGREAFEKAKAEDKPVFLSIGYSTCHWCHVMAHECFEDEEVAEALNRDYVCIKVDREERPDIDGYYMNVCQAMTGSGGWPLSVFLSADRSPFFSGTYFPKEDRAGMIGFLTLLKRIGILWRTERSELSETARKLGEAVLPEKIQSAPVEYDIPKRTMEGLENSFDEEYGGFSRAPKFPSPQNLLFLLRYADTAGSERALELCEKTLVSLRRGGIFDQIGFGFARYSTDRKWLIPHFEKMLYDNALLCMTYAECWELTRKPVYERTARETAAFLLSTMRAENGGFFSALDADSEEGEGIYYSFTPEEVHAVLGTDADEFCRYYGITKEGNFEGRSIPNLLGPEIPEERLEYLDRCREKLLRFRSRRPPPSLDDKLITSRNGLVIAALACAGRIFGDSSFVNAARAAADFFLKQMLTEEGKLLVSYCGKPSPVLGFAEDYAFFLWGLTELYEACFDLKYLEAALKLNQVFLEHFRNEAGAGFRTTDREAEQMPAENVEIFDGATPSANAVQIYNLIRLARLSGQDSLEKTAVKVLESFMPQIRQAPWACPFAALDILYLDGGGTDAALTEGEGFDEMLGVLRSEFRPFLTVRVKGKTERAEASVCSQKACFPAVSTPHDLGKLLKK